ncbi:MAG: AMP-binding protein [Bacteroidales bacterium]|nr:AMP-binding protein [Bacteroidales bacterium]
MKRTIIYLLKNASQNYPDFKFLGEKTDKGWQTISFKETEYLSDLFAIGLISVGYKRNDKLAILSEGRTKWVVGEFGILKSRAVSVPLSIKLTPEEILFRLNHSEAKAILTSHNNIEKVIQSVKNIDFKNFKIIYLDNDLGFVKSLEDKYDYFNAEKNIITFDEIVELGKSGYDVNKSKLDTCLNKIEEDDVVNISYTSGTTGNPKGIMLTHLNYYANSSASTSLFNIPPNSKMFIILPLDHSFAHTAGTFVGLQIPITLYFLDTRGGGVAALKNIPININEIKPTIMFTVPALSGSFMKNIISAIDKKGGFAKWLFNKGLDVAIKSNGNGFNTKPPSSVIYKLANKLVFSKIRGNFGGEILFMVGGGALLDIKQQQFFYAIGMPIYQGYGLTEATPVISANTAELHKLGTSGMVLKNIDCKIIDDGKELRQGQKGEIFIKADSVMKGYFNNPKATAKVLRDGGLYTGDLGYFDEDGFLVVTGRAKALLISEDGEKYSPEEIEETLAVNPFVNHAMLYNDHSKYTTSIINIDDVYIKKFIKDNNILDANKLLFDIETSINKMLTDGEKDGRFQKKWLPAIFRFSPEQFTEDNKMINSTLKMVRYKITQAYRNLIEDMYKPNAKSDKEHNLKILNKFFS